MADWQRLMTSRENNQLVLILFTLLGVYAIIFLQITAHFDLRMTLKHISNDKSLISLKQYESFQLHFLRMATLTTILLSCHNFTLVIYAVFELYVKL